MSTSAITRPTARTRILKLFLIHVVGWAAVGLVLSFFGDEASTPIFTAAGAVFGLLFAAGIAVFGRTRFIGGFLSGGASLISALARAFVAYLATGLILVLLLLAPDAPGLVTHESLRPMLVVPLVSGAVAVFVFIAALRRGHEAGSTS